MSVAKSRPEQVDPPLSAKETLPTMYDLKSENPEEPGLPDEFHLFQPRLLSDTFRPVNYLEDQVFVASDLNLYYDVRDLEEIRYAVRGWYKRPDWFAVVGVDRLYEKRDLRMSYVIWQEGIAPFIVVELLSPGTEKEDLGQSLREANQPPTKWEVYERILRVPYYIIFDRYTDRLRAFQLTGSHYTELALTKPRIWLEEIQLGLGLWLGSYQNITQQWLRWYDRQGNWILADVDRERQEKELAQLQAQRERERANRLAERLRQVGIDPDNI